MAVTCDYCDEQIDEAAPFGIIVSVPQPGSTLTTPTRLDLHQECIAPFAEEAMKIKGSRPRSARR